MNAMTNYVISRTQRCVLRAVLCALCVGTGSSPAIGCGTDTMGGDVAISHTASAVTVPDGGTVGDCHPNSIRIGLPMLGCESFAGAGPSRVCTDGDITNVGPGPSGSGLTVPQPPHPDPTVCATIDVTATPEPPTAVFLVDKSGSMGWDFGSTTRWNALDRALFGGTGVVWDVEDTVRLGIGFFSGGTCGVQGYVGPELGNGAALEHRSV